MVIMKELSVPCVSIYQGWLRVYFDEVVP